MMGGGKGEGCVAGGLPCQLCPKPPAMLGIALSLLCLSVPAPPQPVETTHCVLTACASCLEKERAREWKGKGVDNEGSFAEG